MSGLFGRISRVFGSGKRFAGKDLSGNKYFELPGVNGGRTKRVVEYRVQRDVADYVEGTNRLPVQWTAWLSHTRTDPPSMVELQTDFQRQQTLLSRVAAIEARERDERIRQGYLLADSESEQHLRPAPIAGPSRVHIEPSFSEATAKVSSRPSISSNPKGQAGGTWTTPDVSRPTAPPSTGSPSPPEAETDPSPDASVAGATHRGEPLVQHPRGDMQHPRDGLDTAAEPYPVPTPTSTRVVPPRETIDPSEHNSAEDLRKLAEEDTRRRIEQAGGEAVQPEVVDRPQAEALKPRRRGAK